MTFCTFDTHSSGLELFRTQHELARNFYDDHDFCPLYCHEEDVSLHRERIEYRISPHTSPSASPPVGYLLSHKPNTRAIPIIDPTSMAPVSVPQHPSPRSSASSSSSSSSSQRYGLTTSTTPYPHSFMSNVSMVDPVTGHALCYPSQAISTWS